jgi:hypothetical protein
MRIAARKEDAVANYGHAAIRLIRAAVSKHFAGVLRTGVAPDLASTA